MGYNLLRSPLYRRLDPEARPSFELRQLLTSPAPIRQGLTAIQGPKCILPVSLWAQLKHGLGPNRKFPTRTFRRCYRCSVIR